VAQNSNLKNQPRIAYSGSMSLCPVMRIRFPSSSLTVAAETAPLSSSCSILPVLPVGTKSLLAGIGDGSAYEVASDKQSTMLGVEKAKGVPCPNGRRAQTSHWDDGRYSR